MVSGILITFRMFCTELELEELPMYYFRLILLLSD